MGSLIPQTEGECGGMVQVRLSSMNSASGIGMEYLVVDPLSIREMALGIIARSIGFPTNFYKFIHFYSLLNLTKHVLMDSDA